MNYTTIAIIAFVALIGYFFYRRLRNIRTANPHKPERVKAETYIVCPRCGERMIIESNE